MRLTILQKILVSLVVAVAVGFSQKAEAIIVDLSTSTNSGTIDGATFYFHKYNPSGSGVFDPFVRIQATGQNTSEQGYNTDGTPQFETKNGIWTHSLLFSSLVATDGKYQFALDIGEGGGTDSKLSLDGLKLFSTSSPSQQSNSTDLSGNANGIVGTLLYDMDGLADSYVLLDANRDGNPGNGWSDMLLSISQSVLDNHPVGENNFILWSRFGLQSGAIADNTFEEWAHISFDEGGGGGGGTPVPEPGTLLLLGAGLFGIAVFGKRKLNR